MVVATGIRKLSPGLPVLARQNLARSRLAVPHCGQVIGDGGSERPLPTCLRYARVMCAVNRRQTPAEGQERSRADGLCPAAHPGRGERWPCRTHSVTFRDVSVGGSVSRVLGASWMRATIPPHLCETGRSRGEVQAIPAGTRVSSTGPHDANQRECLLGSAHPCI